GMIATDLVIGPAIGGTQVDILELTILNAEGDSNETARALEGASRGAPRQLDVYRAVVEDGPLHDCVCLAIGYAAIFGNLDSAFAEVFDGLQFYLMPNQLIDALRGQ